MEMKTAFTILLLFLLLSPAARADTVNVVTDEGAVADYVTNYTASVVSNSTTVTINNPGTNTFHTGQVIQLFDAGTNVFSGTNLIVASQDLICLIQSVSAVTNIVLAYPCGVTSTNIHCSIGTQNRTAVQNAINLAETGPGNTVYFPAGNFFWCHPDLLDPTIAMTSEFQARPGVTVTSGSLTFMGTNGTHLFSAGAGVNHPCAGMPGGFAAIDLMRSTLFWITDVSGTMANLSAPLVFTNLDMDGGVMPGTGLQAHNYFPPQQIDGQGWDPNHDAIIQVNSGASGNPQFCSVIITNCSFHGWRGEMVKSGIGSGGTNTAIKIWGSSFYDGNASGINFTFTMDVQGCNFTNLVKTVEFDQHYATAGSLFSNLFWTNIVSNPFSIVGSILGTPPQPVMICGGTNYGISDTSQYTLSPGENITYSNLTLFGPATGFRFTGIGLQPSDGSASYISNIVITGITGNDTFEMFSFDGYPAMNVKVSNCTGASSYYFAEAAGFKSNITFTGCSHPLSIASSVGITSGNYFLVDTNNNFLYIPIVDNVGKSNLVQYIEGPLWSLQPNAAGCVYAARDDDAALIPAGAQLRQRNDGTQSCQYYFSNTRTTIPATIAPAAILTAFWSGSAWSTNLPTFGTLSSGLIIKGISVK